MKIALSGATGFVGRHLAHEFTTRGHEVRALAHSEPPGQAANANVEFVTGDVTRPASLRSWLAGCDAAIHLVGIIAEDGDTTFQRIHVEGTGNVVDAARAEGVERFVHMSALGARDEPDATAYHRTKRQAERAVENSGLSYSILRPSLIFGPGDVVVSMLSRMLRFAPAVPIFGDGRFRLQPVWVGDVAAAFANVVEQERWTGRTLELGGPEQLSYRDVVKTIARVQHTPRPLLPVPVAVFRAIAAVGAALPFPTPLTPDQLQMLLEENITDNNLLPDVIGRPPVPFASGLERMLGSQ